MKGKQNDVGRQKAELSGCEPCERYKMKGAPRLKCQPPPNSMDPSISPKH